MTRTNDDRSGGGRLRRRDVLRAGALGGAALALPWLAQACGASAPAPSGGGSPKHGGSMIWAMDEDPVNLVPLGMTNTSNYYVTSQIYESLTRFDRNLNVRPALAVSWQTPDDLTYVFKLRSGVRFHSGRTFGADDVVYSLQKQKSPPPPGSVNSFYPKIANVEAVDPLTVRITLSEPDTTVLGYFAWDCYSHIVPAGLYERGDPRTQADGTGPFKLVDYVPNDHVTLARNEGYWGAPLPYLDKLTLKVLPDEQSRLAAVRSGAVDGAHPVSADTARSLGGDATLQIQKGLTATFRELVFAIHGDGKPWDNALVRQAVNKAIDRGAIIDKVYGGDAVYTSKIPAGYGQWAIAQGQLRSRWERQDLAGARKLMAQAGHPNGFPVLMQSISQPADYTQIAQVVKAQLAKIGIDVTVRPMEIASFTANSTRGNFELMSTGRGMRGDPSQFFSDFDPAGSIYRAWFKGGYDSGRIMALFRQAMTTIDTAARRRIYDQMQQIALSDCPTIPVVNPTQYQLVRRRVHGMYLDYTGFFGALPGAWVD